MSPVLTALQTAKCYCCFDNALTGWNCAARFCNRIGGVCVGEGGGGLLGRKKKKINKFLLGYTVSTGLQIHTIMTGDPFVFHQIRRNEISTKKCTH